MQKQKLNGKFPLNARVKFSLIFNCVRSQIPTNHASPRQNFPVESYPSPSSSYRGVHQSSPRISNAGKSHSTSVKRRNKRQNVVNVSILLNDRLTFVEWARSIVSRHSKFLFSFDRWKATPIFSNLIFKFIRFIIDLKLLIDVFMFMFMFNTFSNTFPIKQNLIYNSRKYIHTFLNSLEKSTNLQFFFFFNNER